jgi:putative flippase GtrA
MPRPIASIQPNIPPSGARATLGPLGVRWDLIRYVSVGIVNTMVGLATIYLAMYAWHAGDVAANIAGYSVGVASSFILNRRWTFSSRDPVIPQLVRFLLVLTVAYLANLGTVLALRGQFGLNRYLAQALGTLPYVAIGYLGSRFFAFRSPS